MCSMSPDEFPITINNKLLTSDLCRKCSDTACVLLQSKFSYCRNCFLEYFNHKFRATIGKSKIMKHKDRILVGFNGSISSWCLLHLINESLKDEKKKKMSFEVIVLFIDENSALADHENVVAPVADISNLYGFKFYSTDLGAYLANALDLCQQNLYEESTALTQMQMLFSRISTQTSKTDLLKKVRNNILLKVAKEVGCQKIFTAETNDHLAVNTISNIVLGRGSQLPLDIGFSDNRMPGSLLVRPLQDCSREEIRYYNDFNSLKSTMVPNSYSTFSIKADKFSSIQRLSEDFINELLSTYPSTVLTVHATGSKLAAAETIDGLRAHCFLCEGCIDGGNEALSAYEASRISGLVSNLGPDKFDSVTLTPVTEPSCENTCCSTNACDCPSLSSCSVADNLQNPFFCYGCQLILKDSGSFESLPNTVKRHLTQRIHFQKMHNDIQSFLL